MSIFIAKRRVNNFFTKKFDVPFGGPRFLKPVLSRSRWSQLTFCKLINAKVALNIS